MGTYTEFAGVVTFRKGLLKQLLDEYGTPDWSKLKGIRGFRWRN